MIENSQDLERGADWHSREQLANPIFDWIECWYNPHRRHSYCANLSAIDYETATAA